MDKQSYEKLKELRNKVAKGTATFKERNILNILNKKKAKKHLFYFNGK